VTGGTLRVAAAAAAWARLGPVAGLGSGRAHAAGSAPPRGHRGGILGLLLATGRQPSVLSASSTVSDLLTVAIVVNGS
jgi:hypothetical protein